MAALRARAERSPADVVSVLRLAAGLWRDGERSRARQLLEDARAEVPGAHAYTAALATTAEASGDHVAARQLYVEFVRAVGPSPLSEPLAERVSFLRSLTADSLAQLLVEAGQSLDHGQDPIRVIALPLIQAPPGDPDLQRLAVAATELLVRDLRDRDYGVIDWELSEAIRQRVVSGPQERAVEAALAHHLSARVVVLGALQQAEGDSVSIDLRVHRSDGEGGGPVSTDQLTLGTEPYAPHGARLATRVFEIALGATEGAVTPDEPDVSDLVSRDVLLRFGEGLLRVAAGEGEAARAALAELADSVPEFRPAQARLRQVDELEQIRDASELPLADEILAFERALSRARAAIRQSGGTMRPDRLPRAGVGEVLGLDRLGSQVFFDLFVTVAGPS